jgi:hypothetical protein
MEQIPDAPYIREAEQYGMPPYEYQEIDLTEAIKELKECDKRLDDALDRLLDAEDELDRLGFQFDLREAIYRVEDLGCDVRRMMDELIKASA